jgi:hypothetical protein
MADAKYRKRMPEPTPGGVFHHLTAVREATANESAGMTLREAAWLCRCECGNTRVVRVSSLRNSDTKSCGCFRKQSARVRHLKHGCATKRLTGRHTVEYTAWMQMKGRCLNPRNHAYADYGGRGISVCERWLGDDGFANFLADMGEKPTPKHSIDRIDNGKGYSPDNCRWASRIEQANNKRNNVWLEHDGVRLTLPQWARRLGMSASTLYQRVVVKKWPPGDAITRPVANTKPKRLASV